MTGEIPLEPKYVVWRCDHCRNGIEFDVVQLAGRLSCRVPCPHCGRETHLQEPPPPPRLVPDEGWTRPSLEASAVAPKLEKPAAAPEPAVPPTLPARKAPPKVLVIEQPPPPAPPSEPKPITVDLPPDPPPPPRTGGAVDVRWLTDLGVVYFRQHQFGEAFLCFSRAAEQGFATAQFCLAVCYLNGHGTKQNEAAALPWLLKAAAQGDANTEFTIGLAYRFGRGVTPDESLAVQWLQQAARQGHREARQLVGEANPERAVENNVEAKLPPKVTLADPGSEKETAGRRQDLQRLILGLFSKK